MLLVLSFLLLGIASVARFAISDGYYGWSFSEEEIDDYIREYQNHNLSHQTVLLQTIDGWKTATEMQNTPEAGSFDPSYYESELINNTLDWEYVLTELYTYQAMKETDSFMMEGYFHEAITLRARLLAIADIQSSPLFAPYPALKVKIDTMYVDEQNRIKEELPILNRLMESRDYADYIAWNKAFLQNTSNEADLADQLQFLDFRLKIDPEGIHHDNYTIDSIFELLKAKKASLKGGTVTDPSSIRFGQKLTEEETRTLNDEILILYYVLENGIFDLAGNETAADILHSIGMLLVFITVAILSASSVSRELATGSIKSLIIAPCKRWKIYSAKLLSLITVGLGGVIAVWLLSLLSQALFFGLDSAVPYIFASDGYVYTIPYPIYALLKLLIDYIEIFAYMLFAFMLSTVTRSTAVSTGITLGIYGIGGLFSTIVNLFSSAEVQKFVPFNHFALADRIFTSRPLVLGNSALADALDSALDTTAVISPVFSILYLSLLFLSMGWIAFDSFTRRDI